MWRCSVVLTGKVSDVIFVQLQNLTRFSVLSLWRQTADQQVDFSSKMNLKQSIESVKSLLPEHQPAISFFYSLKREKTWFCFLLRHARACRAVGVCLRWALAPSVCKHLEFCTNRDEILMGDESHLVLCFAAVIAAALLRVCTGWNLCLAVSH